MKEHVYIQNADVRAPAGHLPVHVVEEARPGMLTVTPSVAIGGKGEVSANIPAHTEVTSGGVYAVDTVRNNDGTITLRPGAGNSVQFTGENFHWKTSSFTAGLALDYNLSRSVALSGGLSYANGSGTDLWGGYLGVGLMSEGPVFGMRIDGGVQWTPVLYSVHSAVEREYSYPFSSDRDTRVDFYYDVDHGSPLGWFAGLTLNTRVTGWIVQPFVNATLSKQRFFSFEPATYEQDLPSTPGNPAGTEPLEASTALFLVSPGLALDVGPSQRVLLGVKMAFVPDFLNGNDGTGAGVTGSTGYRSPLQPFVAPFVQVDIGL